VSLGASSAEAKYWTWHIFNLSGAVLSFNIRSFECSEWAAGACATYSVGLFALCGLLHDFPAFESSDLQMIALNVVLALSSCRDRQVSKLRGYTIVSFLPAFNMGK
jgi:hypothetical protein